MAEFDTLTDEQKAALLAQQSEMQSSYGSPADSPPPLQPGPGVPMAPPPPPVQSSPYDPGQAYDQAALAGPGPAASAAWGQYAGTGQTSSPARVYPPVQPGALNSKMLKYALPDRQPDPGEEVMRLAQSMNVPIQQAIQAIDAQQRFQAQRGYKADLDRGVSAEDAAVKWFPMMMGSTTTRGGAGMPGIPGMAKPPTPMTEFQQAEVANWKARQNKITPTKATKAVENTYTALKSAELIAQQQNEPRKVRDAVKATAEFVAQHPELGLSPGGNQPPPTATGTMPGPVTPPVVSPRNRIYMGPNTPQSEQALGIMSGARAGSMNPEAMQAPVRPPVAAPAVASAAKSSPYKEGQIRVVLPSGARY